MLSVLASLRLELLGGFAARSGAGPISLPTRKTEALLAYLALAQGNPIQREALARLLWGAHGAEHARNSLRQAVTALRKALGPAAGEVLDVGRDTVALDPGAVDTDVHALERLTASPDPDDLRHAAELYRGEFLLGFEALHAPAFEEWRAREATRLRGLAVTALLTLLGRGTGAEPGSDAVASVARRLLELDPLQEPAHRALMRHYAVLGQPALVLEQYEACHRVLAARMGVAPMPETEALREALAAGRRGAPATIACEATLAPTTPPDTAGFAPPVGRPALVVLPFANLGGDLGQEYFADGITEDITTELSRSRWLTVIARGSAFTYKGTAVDLNEVSRTLRVGYVLEGSVRKAGGRLRLTVRLIDTSTGAHLWGDRVDCALTGIFEVQDEITRRVVASIEASIRQAEIGRALTRPTESLEAYDLYLRSLPRFYRLTQGGSSEALHLLGRATQADPGYARARAYAGLFHAMRFGMWWGDDEEEVTRAVRLAYEALEFGQEDVEALRAAGYSLGYTGHDHEAAVAALDRALLLGGRGSAPVLNMSGRVRYFAGDWRTAIEHLERAAALSPLDPEMHYFLSGISMAHFVGGQYAEAAEFARRSIRLQPGWATAHRQLVASLANLGHLQEARSACRTLTEILPPHYSVGSNRKRLPFRNQEVVERFLDGLRQAGVPE